MKQNNGSLKGAKQAEESKTSSGISEDRVVNTNDNKSTMNKVTCPICFNIIWKPTTCSGCKASYCQTCMINSIKSQNTTTPLCTNRCSFKPDVNPLLASLLSDLKISCIFKNLGCKEILSYDALEKHETQCLNTPCTCSLCIKSYLRKNQQDHEKVCEEAEIILECCEAKIKRKNRSKHEELKCFQLHFPPLKLENVRLKQASSYKDDEISKLILALEAKDALMSKIIQSPAEKDAQISVLKKISVQKDAEISRLREALTEKDAQITILSSQEITQEPGPVKKSKIERKIEDKNQTQSAVSNSNNGILIGLPIRRNILPHQKTPPECILGHKLEVLDLKSRSYPQFQCALCVKLCPGNKLAL
jgi:hypothetical protein